VLLTVIDIQILPNWWACLCIKKVFIVAQLGPRERSAVEWSTCSASLCTSAYEARVRHPHHVLHVRCTTLSYLAYNLTQGLYGAWKVLKSFKSSRLLQAWKILESPRKVCSQQQTVAHYYKFLPILIFGSFIFLVLLSVVTFKSSVKKVVYTLHACVHTHIQPLFNLPCFLLFIVYCGLVHLFQCCFIQNLGIAVMRLFRGQIWFSAIIVRTMRTETWNSCRNKKTFLFRWTMYFVMERVSDHMFRWFLLQHTHTHTQPFYGSVEFVRENPGDPVPEETFTHYSHRSHQSSLSAFSI